MSKARDRYEKLVDDIPEDSTMGEAIRNYVSELESEKAELIKFVKDIAFNDIGSEYKWPTEKAFDLLKKHGVKI